MESVTIEVQRGRSVRGGEGFEVFGDGGSGVLNTQTPLTDRPVWFWAGRPRQAGHLFDGHLGGRHMDSIAPDGHLSGRHLAAEHLWSARLLSFATRRLYFGRFQFAVGMVDGAGNRSSILSPVVQRIVNSSPRRASDLSRSGFDAASRRLSFSFAASPDL